MKHFFLFIALVSAVGAKSQTELIAKRLSKLQTNIPYTSNDAVQRSIRSFLNNDSNTTSEMLGWSNVWLKTIKDSLLTYGIPEEIKYLPAAVSQYDNWKVSEEGGSGIWQMRYLTAREYGLHLSSYVDQRRDIPAATSAACQHLRNLKKVYPDWRFVLVAFYSGEVEVNKAIRKAGGSMEYWTVHAFLPVRYQSIIPDFIAAVYIHHHADDHKISRSNIILPQVEAVPIAQWTTIYQMSRALEIGFDTLKNLNPTYKKQVIPRTQRQYELKIPFEKVARFYELGDSVYTYQTVSEADSTAEPRQNLEMDRPDTQEPEMKPAPTTNSKKLVYYTVKKGDYLGRIADLYDVRVSDVRRWNGIRGDQININQRLKIYVPASQYDKYSKINGMSGYQKQQIINKD